MLLRLKLIGRMEALTLGNESVLPLGRKTRALLAILALNGRRPVLRLRLAELLWSRRSEGQARASLRQEIHRLSEALSPLGTDVITVDRHTMALKPALTSVDAERILTARPGQADSLPPIEGMLLEELSGTDPALDAWLATERARLRDHAMELFEEMLGRHRDPEAILIAAKQLLSLDPCHTRAWLATLKAHRALGNLALARQLGERCIAMIGPASLGAAQPDLLDALQGLGLEREAGAPALVNASDAVSSTPPTETGEDAAAPTLAVPPSPLSPAPGGVAPAATWPAPQHQAGDQPLLVIIPVMALNAGNDPRIGSFAAGLVQTLQTTLVGNSWSRVVSDSALDECLSQGRDDALLRRRFGVRFVVDGTIQTLGDTVRVILRMSDIAANGQLLWAKRFDGRIDGLLALQDQIAAHASARLPTEIVVAEAVQSRRLPEAELEPHQLAALTLLRLNGADRAGVELCIGKLEHALEAAPDSAHLHTVLCLSHLIMALQRWGDPALHAQRADAEARAALAINPSETVALAVCALILSELQDRPDAALGMVERALRVDPYSSLSWAAGAIVQIRLGRLDEAERFVERYKELFDTHPFAGMLDLACVMLALLRGDFEEAARLGLQHTELHPGLFLAHVPYLAALGHLGRSGEAARTLERLLQAWPDSDAGTLVSRAGLRDPVQAAILRDGLLLAGLRPEAGESHAGEPGGGDAKRASPTVDGATAATVGSTAPRSRRARRPLGAEPLAG
ncbi:hypothetical protein NFI95_12455 [Acetobacteraceae bacterium KSS8]|uniref:Bacterial transcriptional activator domain-containing protein n=1 Tax=Endosaccharibacter trunci TaxID=2812733 RepID=A0ABT1WA37_9PROT|nr:hypothetical protein [Acetobacteraceae bacterium KSS8]